MDRRQSLGYRAPRSVTQGPIESEARFPARGVEASRTPPATVLVIGVHREELGFGDRVAALLGESPIQVMRIPEGISNARGAGSSLFHYQTRQAELYLQLRQQLRSRYGLLIDLHCGLDVAGRCADVYCRSRSLLNHLASRAEEAGLRSSLRLAWIMGDFENHGAPCSEADTAARTSVPERIWRDKRLVYVGLEVYLPEPGVGTSEDWVFACDLVEQIRACAPRLG